MSESEIDILTAIRQRMSVRSYDGARPVSPALLERLLAVSEEAGHLTGAPPRIALLNGVGRTRRVLSYMIGSYGLIQNPPHLLVGVLPEESDLARLDLGYVLEQVVLEATRLGISTCWITGSYDGRRTGDAVGLAPGEVAAAVCALGYPAANRLARLHNRAVRRLAGGQRRKPLSEIVFAGRWGKRWVPEDADPALVEVLEYARLAPSASNRQPWRFIVRPGDVALALARPTPIDGGIAMSHLALASAALGREGQWQVRLGDSVLAQELGLPRDALPVAIWTPVSS